MGKANQDDDTVLLVKKDAEENDTSCGIKARHSLALLSFLGFFNVYCMRVNLSVALVAMVNSSASNTKNLSNQCSDHSNTTTLNAASTVQNGEFNWDESTQALILGAFFYGYVVTQVPGGWLAERIGGKKLFGFGCLATAVLTLLTPVAARAGVPYLVALRVLEGMGEGVTAPATHALWAVWAPLYERSKLVAFTYSGSQLGTVFAMPLTGILCEHGFAGGWPSAFYVFGILGCAWFVLWMLMAFDSPAQHPRISDSERRFIEASVGQRMRLSVPWCSVFTSPAVLGIILAHFASNWGFYSMLTSLPTYMSSILHFKLTQNGFISALPYIILWLTQMTSGIIADFLRRRGFLSTISTRKLMNTVGLLCPACLLVATGYAGCDKLLAVALLTLGVGGGGFSLAGYGVNHLDIAPKFAGTLMGVTNAIATVPGFLGPAVVGFLTDNDQTSEQWRIFFFITAAIYLVGATGFLLLAKGEEQPWARVPGLPSLSSTLNQECVIATPGLQKPDEDEPRECHGPVLATVKVSVQGPEERQGKTGADKDCCHI